MSTKTATIDHSSHGEIIARDSEGNVIASKRRTNNPAALAQIICTTEMAGYVIDWNESTVAQPESPAETYDYRDIRNSGWISDLYDARPGSGFPDIDPTKMSAEDVAVLADYLRADDGSLSEEDVKFSAKVADQVEALIR